MGYMMRPIIANNYSVDPGNAMLAVRRIVQQCENNNDKKNTGLVKLNDFINDNKHSVYIVIHPKDKKDKSPLTFAIVNHNDGSVQYMKGQANANDGMGLNIDNQFYEKKDLSAEAKRELIQVQPVRVDERFDKDDIPMPEDDIPMAVSDLDLAQPPPAPSSVRAAAPPAFQALKDTRSKAFDSAQPFPAPSSEAAIKVVESKIKIETVNRDEIRGNVQKKMNIMARIQKEINTMVREGKSSPDAINDKIKEYQDSKYKFEETSATLDRCNAKLDELKGDRARLTETGPQKVQSSAGVGDHATRQAYSAVEEKTRHARSEPTAAEPTPAVQQGPK
jgi:hypothetical protein